MLKLRKNKKGFTLVELIVVIAIMAVLAGTVAGVTVSQLNKQKNNSAKSEVSTLMNDFRNFMLDYEKKSEILNADTALAAQSAGEAAVEAFAKEAKATDGKAVFAGEDEEAKAGNHKFRYAVTVSGTAKPFTVTVKFYADKVGGTNGPGSAPEVTWDITDATESI